MKTIQNPSPNFDSRDGQAIDMLVLHYTGMKSAHEALERLCNPTAKVSAHYMIDEDGTIYQLVDEKNRAWHAGVSSWCGNTNINQRSIGIEIVNKGHEFGYTVFPEEQMQSVIALCKDIITRHNIVPRNIVGHSDIAPTRKQDPGELFNWKLLAENGIGLFPDDSSISEAKPLLESELAKYGYDIADLPQAITAFQRHFRPNNLSGIWDDECSKILAGLLDTN
ncbi:MAG: N-acetylmuramoyl-L-alanine amidase [Rickettsiales bacterium]